MSTHNICFYVEIRKHVFVYTSVESEDVMSVQKTTTTKKKQQQQQKNNIFSYVKNDEPDQPLHSLVWSGSSQVAVLCMAQANSEVPAWNV